MTTASPTLTIHHPRPTADHRLVVFPHAGSGAAFYRAWGRALGPRIEVQTVQYPGRENRIRDPLVSDPDALVDEVRSALSATAATGRPWTSTVLLGHSMGALLAYETAAALTAEGAGTAPAGLIVSGCPAPGTATPATPRTDADLLAALERDGGTPMRLLDDPDIRALVLRVLHNDYRLVDTLRLRRPRHRPPLNVPFTVLRGRQDHHTGGDRLRGWAGLTTFPVREHAFDGGHFYFVRQLDRVLSRVRERFPTDVSDAA
ncbi:MULTISPECIES: thioesterase II family protein [unclassified Streptomyces]|uniref:thioesterase II family protein n=1 Tax=unclassified Streptomyces TaxID=2593676 RepID=UPI00278C75E1|nr:MULTISPECIES: alpha/beta fold hydrolase [unclassified Streptomyces]